LQDHAIDSLEQVSRSINVRRLQQIVRAFHYEDAILSVRLNENRRHAAGDSFDLLHMGSIDPQLLEVLNGGRTEQIAAHPSNHEDLSATKPGSHRLIRPLTPKAEIELLAKNRFSGFGETIGKGSQINIRA